MIEDNHDLEVWEIPGARWHKAALELVRWMVPTPRFPGADQVRARLRTAPQSETVRQRVQDARTRWKRPAVTRVPAPVQELESSREEFPGLPQPAEGRGLDPVLQRRMETFLNMQLPLLRIHTGQVADRFARSHNADAVTVRNNIYFRQGTFDPGTARGIGLLTHEATHVAWDAGARPQSHFGPAATGAVEERVALENERRVLHSQSVPASASPRPIPHSLPPSMPSGPARVKTALASRDLIESETAAPSAPELSGPQVRALKDQIYRGLLDKLRSDFERGA